MLLLHLNLYQNCLGDLIIETTIIAELSEYISV